MSAAVLAGGKSSRMGRDKAALPFGGGTLLTYQARKLRALGVKELLLSGAAEAVPGARLVPDLLPGRGPLGGLHACLSAAAWRRRGRYILDQAKVCSEQINTPRACAA